MTDPELQEFGRQKGPYLVLQLYLYCVPGSLLHILAMELAVSVGLLLYLPTA